MLMKSKKYSQPVGFAPAGRWLFVAALLTAFFSSGPAFAAPPSNPTKAQPILAPLYAELAPQLQAGGNIIYAVPGPTTGEDQTNLPNWWQQCPTTKMLTTGALEQTYVIGRAMQSLGLFTGLIRTGQLCRQLNTASAIVNQIMYPTPDLNPVTYHRQNGLKDIQISAQILSHLQTGAAPGTNTLVVGTILPPEIAPHPVLADLQDGETAIFRNSPTGLTLLARLTPLQWKEMADYIVHPSETAQSVKTKKK